MRLDKFLCECTAGSRSQVKKSIRKGEVTVNGMICRQPEQKISPETDCVIFGGEKLNYRKYEYYMLNKPGGCVCASCDNLHDTVFSYLPMNGRENLFCVGRLDLDTEGLLLITNDGELAHRLLSPRKHVQKTYRVKVKGKLTPDDADAFVEGIDIGEKRPTQSAELTIFSSGDISEGLVVISEGKFHQVKRMFQALGKEVVFLKRISMGKFVLDPKLQPGEYRILTKEEMEYVEEYKSGHI